jgi:hypothetical protein
MGKCDGINCQKRHDYINNELGVVAPMHNGERCWHIDVRDKNWLAEIKLAHRDYIDIITEIAQRMKQQVVIPFCDKHNLCFYCGMGTYCFSKPDNISVNAYYSDTPDSQAFLCDYEGYEEVLAALNTEVPDNMGYGLFLFIGDYDPNKKEESSGAADQT